MHSGKHPQVLLVEDVPALRLVLGDSLRRVGYRVYEASDGLEGVALALDLQLDLILVNIIMPRMDGVTMAKQLRKLEQYKDVPIFFISNLTFDEVRPKLKFMTGPVYFMCKNIHSLQEIVNKVHRCIRIRNSTNLKK